MSSIFCSLFHCAFDTIVCIVIYYINFYSSDNILINAKKRIKQNKKKWMYLKKKFVNNFQNLIATANQDKLLDLY